MVRGKDVVGIQDWENNAQFHSRGVSDIGGWRGGGEGSSAETDREIVYGQRYLSMNLPSERVENVWSEGIRERERLTKNI